MPITYDYRPRVRHKSEWEQTGEVATCVPGNGSIPWYFVRWDNGVEDRHTADELELE